MARFHGQVNFRWVACYPSSTEPMARDSASGSDAPVATNLNRDHEAMPHLLPSMCLSTIYSTGELSGPT